MNVQWSLLLPELVLTGAVVLLLVQAMGPKAWAQRLSPANWLPVAGLASALLALAVLPFAGGDGVTMFYGAYRVDGLAQFFKLAVGVALAVSAANVRRLDPMDSGHKGDWFLLLGLAGWGFAILASCVELVTMLVALEAASFSLYGLVPLRAKEKRAAEAGIKYVLFGAAATGLALYGLGAIIAGVGTTHLDGLSRTIYSFSAAPMATLGLALFVLGFVFNLALFPFHFWAPDVYEGTANETAMAVASLPKLGAVVVLVRLAALVPVGQSFAASQSEVTLLLAVLAAASMTFGNLMALVQTDVKRLLGFSSVAHAGYLMLGLVSGTPQGLAAAAFYALVYALTTLTAFWVVGRYAPTGQNVRVKDLSGMYRQAPMLAFALAASAFALVGLPPTAGFMGKLFLLTAAWNQGFAWLVVVVALNTAIAIFYYLNLVRAAYTADAETQAPPAGADSALSGTVAAALAVALLGLGLVPGPVFDLALAAGNQLLP